MSQPHLTSALLVRKGDARPTLAATVKAAKAAAARPANGRSVTATTDAEAVRRLPPPFGHAPRAVGDARTATPPQAARSARPNRQTPARLSLRLTPDDHRRLRILAANRATTLQSLLAEAVTVYLDRTAAADPACLCLAPRRPPGDASAADGNS
ncbi:MAG: hypothetical protein RIE31_11470 [Alphaproteobacteria bacterium]